MRRGQARIFKIQFQSHGGLIFGAGKRVGFSADLNSPDDRQNSSAGRCRDEFLCAVERWESNKERALMRRCVTLKTIRRDGRAGSLFNEVVIWGRELWGDFPC